MTKAEIIQRERITLREIRTALIDKIEAEFSAALKRLDDWEMRETKSALTGGEPSFKIADAQNGGKPPEDEPIDVEIVAPSTARPAAFPQPGSQSENGKPEARS